MTKDIEYSTLRDEIINLVEIQSNYIIAMYTITVSIIGFAIERNSEWLFLLPYIILFSFQRIISSKNDGMIRIAAYIAVFLEENHGWESMYADVVKRTTVKHNNRKTYSRLKSIIGGRISSLQLGLACSIGCIITNILNEEFLTNTIQSIQFIDILPTIIAICLYFTLRGWCGSVNGTMNKRSLYIESLKLLRDEK